jgi:hypothetical protein
MLLKYSNDHEADYFELQVSVIHRQVKDGTTTFVERWEPVRSWIPGIGKRDFSKEME